MRTPTQTRAVLESPRVRVPQTAQCELPATTQLRSPAHTQYRRRYRSAFAHCPPRSGARLPYLVDEDPGTAHRLTLRARGPAHRDIHYRHKRATWKPSPPIDSGSVQTAITDPPTIQPSPLVAGSFRPTVVVEDTLNRLNHRAISGEIRKPSGKGACDMRSTGTESDSVSAHAAPHFRPCAGQPPDDDVPRRTDWGHLTIAADTYPAPASVGLARSGHPPVSHSLSPPSPTVERRKSQGGTGHHTRPIDRYLALTPTTTRTDAPPLTQCRLRFSCRHIRIDSLASSAPVTLMNRNRCYGESDQCCKPC